ncbi:MAG: hypothetical protein AAF149_20345 [Bacteroidota bacterium]
MTIKEKYKDLLSRNADVELKGKNLLYTSRNDHMYSQTNKAGQLELRLSKEDDAEFMQRYDSEPFKSYGAFMRGYVVVPDSVLKDHAEIDKYLKKSMEYIKTLEPK